MPTPILKIQVDDSAFQRFKTLYDDYTSSVKAQPGAWRLIGEEQGAAWTRYEKMMKAIGQMPAAQQGIVAAMKEHQKLLENSERMWVSVTHKTKDFYENIKGATEWLLRWSGILTVVGGVFDALSIWGIMRMAGQISASQKVAGGLGVSIGQEKAFGLAYRPIFNDPAAYLGWVHGMETDVRKQGPMSYLLHGQPTGNTMTDALAMMDSIRGILLSTEKPLWQSRLTSMDVQMTPDEMQRMHDYSPQDYGELRGYYTAKAKELNIGDDTGSAWEKFMRTMDEVGDKMHKTLGEGLVKISGPLSALAMSFAHMMETIVSSDLAKDAISSLAKWMENTAKTFDSKTVEQSVKKFLDELDSLGGVMHAITHPIEAIGAAMPNLIVGLTGIYGSPIPDHNTPQAKDDQARNLRLAAQMNEVFGLPKGMLIAQTLTESGGYSDVANSPKGAQGVMQIEPATRDYLNKKYGLHLNPYLPGEAYHLGALYDKELIEKFGSDPEGIRKALAAYNAGPNAKDGIIASNNPNWLYGLPTQTQQAVKAEVKVMVDVQNGTGSDINATVHQVPSSGMGDVSNAIGSAFPAFGAAAGLYKMTQ